jgi:predicted house-cleaning noncanonical NTP pyrophosphatase (MazG superfamily)
MLSPIQDVTLFSGQNSRVIRAAKLNPTEIGWKAFGLASIPPEWTAPFLVINSSYSEHTCSDDKLVKAVRKFFKVGASDTAARVYVRSSGVSETIRNRGQLESRHCEISNIANTIRQLRRGIPAKARKQMHWIVQQLIPAIEAGHLSNERHLKKESRDWVVEFELSGNQLREPISIGIRKWRDGIENPDLNLRCGSQFAIPITLKNVSKWAMQYGFRIHFEWVWSGDRIYIVQAEQALSDIGVNPYELMPASVDKVSPVSLRVFKVATDSDFESLQKLKNAKLYRKLGYSMPDFFVAPVTRYLRAFNNGHIPVELDLDLTELTKRPLVIRTDGENIPADKKEMLPRSDELRSCDEAKDWIANKFSNQIKESGLDSYSLKFIAHQFIPSVASAWARAEPYQRLVRIESLWGIPEGLYYFAHDTFEIDTKVCDLKTGSLVNLPEFGIKKRIRYKRQYIGPDNSGRWVPYQTAPPHDWTSSIKRNRWLAEIAESTRLVAEAEGHPVSVMWFIDNHKDATKHRVLPWFHSQSNIVPAYAATPRQKYSKSRLFEIQTANDWKDFQQKVREGIQIERVVLQPTDPDLIRNANFAKDLGSIAESKGIVVELSGGILSHAYYLLQRSGAKVEVRDLFGTDEDIAEFHKVVRDKVPDVIRSGGEEVETVTLCGDALVVALQRKLVEEALEALDAKSGEALLSELADVEEVLVAVRSALNISREELAAVRAEKVRQRGGFERAVMLTRTFTPHSIHFPREVQPAPNDDFPLRSLVISDPVNLPKRRPYRRPDLRTVDEQPEKLLTFEVELTELDDVKQVLNFTLPIDGKNRSFVLTVDLERKNSRLRETVSLRVEPVQLELKF